jgi:hypothetical protein
MKKITVLSLVFILFACKPGIKKTEQGIRHRFFSDDSFWNQPIPDNAETDSLSSYYIGLLKTDPSKKNFGVNLTRYTIPIFEVNNTAPKYKPGYYKLTKQDKIVWKTDRDFFGHGAAFDADSVPIPPEATSSPGDDRHLAIIDWQTNTAWDMWSAVKQNDGTWHSNTGMKYSLTGPGVFKTEDFDIIDGESIHFHGPGRAAGVPIIAGLILLDEVKAGEINHKIAAATHFNAFQEFVFPAAWTDGMLEGGIPEGAVIQLDTKLDISKFNLLSGEIIIAKALQKYGMVIVDNAGGNVLYGELQDTQNNKSWKGLVREWDGGIVNIPLDNYRVVKLGKIIKRGDKRGRFAKGVIPDFNSLNAK